MLFEIRGRNFEIELVNNWCRLRYQDLIDATERLTLLPGQVQDLAKEATETKDKEELKRIKEELKSYKGKTGEYTREIMEIRISIIEELLDSNGLNFDRNFWLKRADIDDVNDFILDCLTKDVKDKKSSKKK
jgi:hypothetical protein